MALFLLDSLEQHRDLSLEEWNFRLIVQCNIATLLRQQRIYWKQRGDIKWATLGDGNTKFFHATATIKHNKSFIMALKDSEGLEVTKHEDKASILLKAFRDRLGSSDFVQIHFN
jgi:hypothetical protein